MLHLDGKTENVQLGKPKIYTEYGKLYFSIPFIGDGYGGEFGDYEASSSIIISILEVMNCSSWANLEGRYARMKFRNGGIAKVIGNIIEDKWFDIDPLDEEVE